MSPSAPAAVVVLAAGEGTRMRSATPKVLHAVAGRPLVGHAVRAALSVAPEVVTVVVGHGRAAVTAYLAEHFPDVRTAVQEEQRGTGHAVMCALEQVKVRSGTLLVTYGDVPLLTPGTLRRLVDEHETAGAGVSIVTTHLPDPTGYGRVVRDDGGGVLAVVEQKDATVAEASIPEVNSGIYAFDVDVLQGALGRLTTDNAQGELYLTDVVGLARADGRGVLAVPVADPVEVEGVNDRVQLAALHREANRRVLEHWMRAGVTVLDPTTTWVEADVELEPDVVLRPNTALEGATRVRAGAQIGPDVTLRSTEVGAGAVVVRAQADSAVIGDGATVGPYAYLRPGALLGTGSKVGTFVEVKNAELGPGAKVPHLTYVGDATIGEGTNIGAATVFVNYDGVAKHRTTIGAHARTGADNMFVAPVVVGDGAYTAAGSVITQDVPPGAMAVARGQQRNVEGWVQRRRPGTDSARAAEAARRHTEGSATGEESGA